MATKEKPIRFRVWLRAMRIQFLQASLVPVGVGSALAWREGTLSWTLFIGAVLAIAAINIGANLANDYYDHRSGADERNRTPTPFSGGSRVIQEGLLTARQVLIGSIVAFASAVVIGTGLMFSDRPHLLGFGVAGIALGIFYTAPPLKLGYRGWGEGLVGFLLGPLAVTGAYYLQTKEVTPEAVALSLPVGFLVSAILYVNQFPDAESDGQAGKMHWVARLGPDRAVPGYWSLLGAAYLSLFFAVLGGFASPWILLTWATLPLAVGAARSLRRVHDRPAAVVPVMAMTILLHLSVGMLIVAALIVERLTS